mmetsp:Transcript_23607/g.38210  ORF Transcript_23607/g.38210 Transcript_23607/m.38210 type:complete len:84 (+) Transcript_23607:1885-2136(+)
MTAILSALTMVLRRWAMTSTVRRPSRCSRSRASCTCCSLSRSSAEVASSSSRILGFLTSARAMAIRCFCPPLSFEPPSPTFVS